MLALFFESGAYGIDYILRIGDEKDIRDQLIDRNDWFNLEQCGRIYGTKKDQKILDKLKEFIFEEQTRGSIEKFNITLSTGTIKNIMVAENEPEAQEIIRYLEKNINLSDKEQDKFKKFCDQILGSFRDDELYDLVFNKIASRQYVTSGIATENF